MKKTITLALSVSLFTAITVFGDGNQGSGNRTNDCTDPNNCPPAECVAGCPPGGTALMSETDEYTSGDWQDAAEVIGGVTMETIELLLF